MFSRYISNFVALCALIGLPATLSFLVSYALNKVRAPGEGALYSVPIGPYRLYYPSREEFAGRFMEIFIRQFYELNETAEAIRVLDCGANIGMSLLYIKLKMPNARVLCFEPNPDSLKVLEKNIQANKWVDVEALPYALGKEEGVADFFLDAAVPTSSSASLVNSVEGERPVKHFSVEVKRLSGYITVTVDFLKMDIEGAEYAVFEDLAERQALPLVKQIQLEYHYHPRYFSKTISQFTGILEGAGFRVRVLPLAEHPSPEGDAVFMVYASR